MNRVVLDDQAAVALRQFNQVLALDGRHRVSRRIVKGRIHIKHPGFMAFQVSFDNVQVIPVPANLHG
ncbi:hypothetical protein D3C74_324730 [compost metagenome]